MLSQEIRSHELRVGGGTSRRSGLTLVIPAHNAIISHSHILQRIRTFELHVALKIKSLRTGVHLKERFCPLVIFRRFR